MRQLQSLSFVLLFSFILFMFKILYLCVIILLLKLLVQLYYILIVFRLNFYLYGLFSSKDVVIKLKNYLSVLELTVKLNGVLKTGILFLSNICSWFLIPHFTNELFKSPSSGLCRKWLSLNNHLIFYVYIYIYTVY